ncbi:MAG: 50S ribosomal protein L9 [Synergistaceae bacterium]|jgi:large subunit ribosomal protein L9|nr:50S ribosomal protein L9 [Synergistaceae bacterium]
MKVILLQDVSKVGVKGDLVEVSDGYGRNFLIKRGLASEGTEGKVREWEENQKVRKNREAKLEQSAAETKKKIGGKRVSVLVNAGEEGRLFGSVTTGQIAEALKQQHGIEVDRHDIKLEETVKNVGVYPFKIRLYPGIETSLSVEVKAG